MEVGANMVYRWASENQMMLIPNYAFNAPCSNPFGAGNTLLPATILG
jgi:hypothetical protein